MDGEEEDENTPKIRHNPVNSSPSSFPRLLVNVVTSLTTCKRAEFDVEGLRRRGLPGKPPVVLVLTLDAKDVPFPQPW